jgi:hypothetical protein
VCCAHKLIPQPSFNKAELLSRAVVQAFKVVTEEVGVIGMSYNMEIVPVRKGLVGPAPRWPGQAGNTWNVYEWRWSS